MPESQDFSFRIRFDLPEMIRVNIADDRWCFGPVNGVLITLKSEPNGPIEKAGRLSCTGHGFPDERSARLTGELVRDILTVAFARAQVPADFGDRAHRSHITEHGLKMLEQQHGKRILQDIHGLQTFVNDPKPSFARFNIRPVVGRSGEAVKASIAATIPLEPALSAQMRTAYDLYAASSGVENADARLLLLMMAIETLLDQREREGSGRKHVDHLINLTAKANLPDEEKNSLLSSLKWLKLESIASAGRRLANTLAGQYNGLSAERFFMRCYEVRGRLVHGHHPRMDPEDVGTLAATLETFVGDIISTPVLGQRQIQQGDALPGPSPVV
jgi:hypothetical protein